MHVLPSSKIPFPKVPLDTMIANKVNFLKKLDKKEKEYQALQQPVHDLEDDAQEAGLLLVDEFPFDHAVYQVNLGDLNADTLKYGYKKIYNFLQLARTPDAGLTLILTPQWMFVAPIYEPYHKERFLEDVPNTDLEGGVPVYLDGFSYAGILNIQPIV